MPRLRQISAQLLDDGCPIPSTRVPGQALARSVRKSGIPRTCVAWDFLTLGFLLATVGLLSACRIDMHVQPRQNPLSRSDFFSDQRSERPPVEGTVARGQLHEDTYFYTGKLGNNPGDYMPFPVTKEVLERGRERYNIYCAPCHSRTRRRQRLHSVARFRAQAALLSHPAAAESSARLFLRRDHQRLRHHARLRLADSAARPLEYRGLHPRAATKSKRNQGGRARWPDRSLGTAEVPRPARFGRDAPRH